MIVIVGWICLGVLVLLSFVAVYQWALAVASIRAWGRPKPSSVTNNLRFLVLIPAHNEQYALPRTLESVQKVRYPSAQIRVVVLADRCHDDTAGVAKGYGVECLERVTGKAGKGAAIAWAIDELRKNLKDFDALIILDADTVVDPFLLEAFQDGLISGYEVQQGYNYISNPWETPFTRIIAVTSVLRNGLFYTGKSRIGLSGMLMGTGMCFSRGIVEHYGWTAFSVGEDWEFSVSLLLSGEKIHFNPMARVFAQESHNFQQASTQRLRWASGRYAVAARSAWELVITGIRRRRAYLLDAAVTLLSPNYSTQATLAFCALLAAWVVSSQDPAWHFLLTWATVVMGSLIVYFLVGVVFTESPWRALGGIALIPVFLPWRMTIELLGFLGYGRKRWSRTTRVTISRR